MYKIRANISKILFLPIIVFMSVLQGCETSSDTNPIYLERRSPTNNPSASSQKKITEMEESKQLSNVKRSDSNYDAYQTYQSINAPVSLKDLKKVKRRPVLNISELNALMDDNKNKHSKPTASKDKATTNSEPKEKAPCMDANCNLKEAIQYNKQQKNLKKTKSTTPAPVAVPAKVKDPMPASVAPVVIPPVKVPAPVTAPVVKAKAVKIPAPMAVPAKVKEPMPMTPGVIPPVKVPAPVVAPVAKVKVVKAIEPVTVPAKVKDPVPMPAIPEVIPPKDSEPAVEPVMAPIMPQVKAVVPRNEPTLTSAKVETKVPAVSQMKASSTSKLDTINTVLVGYYHGLKNKISGFFQRGN